MDLRRMTSFIFVSILFGLLINPQPVHSQPSCYIWTDEEGKVRFANDLSEVPEKYKKLAIPGPPRVPEKLKERIDKKGTGAEEEKAKPLGDSTFAASSIPKLQVVAQYNNWLSILVPQNTTTEQLKALILEFRSARKTNTLSKMIPATTPGNPSGHYAIVGIFVFSEADWATVDKLKRFIESKSDADLQFDKEYIKHIKAVYSYIASLSSEEGSLGYYDGHLRSQNYEKLWTDEFTREIERRIDEKGRTEARKKLVEKQFSAWDGSHRNLTRVIKRLLNDPDSYKHVETVYWDRGDHLIVKTTFRGKNAFGGVVLNWVKAKVDLNGDVLKIIEQGP